MVSRRSSSTLLTLADLIIQPSFKNYEGSLIQVQAKELKYVL